jgi:hypothetical protein
MGIDKELNLIDKSLTDYKGPEDLIGEQGLLKQLTKALVERAMNAELAHHLGYEKHDQRKQKKICQGEKQTGNGVYTKSLTLPQRQTVFYSVVSAKGSVPTLIDLAVRSSASSLLSVAGRGSPPNPASSSSGAPDILRNRRQR